MREADQEMDGETCAEARIVRVQEIRQGNRHRAPSTHSDYTRSTHSDRTSCCSRNAMSIDNTGVLDNSRVVLWVL